MFLVFDAFESTLQIGYEIREKFEQKLTSNESSKQVMNIISEKNKRNIKMKTALIS